MNVRPFLLATLLASSIALAPKPAEAGARLGLGAHYWLVKAGVFDLDLTLDTMVASSIAVGGRFGFLFTSSPTDLGVPIDLLMRFYITSPIFLEVMGGPWIFFDSGPLRAHFAVALGIQTGSIAFGPEVGYLEPRAIIGMKLAFRL
jgi:hypothetical protein